MKHDFEQLARRYFDAKAELKEYATKNPQGDRDYHMVAVARAESALRDALYLGERK